jgi:hypothetical protein
VAVTLQQDGGARVTRDFASSTSPKIGFDVVFTSVKDENIKFKGTLQTEGASQQSWRGSFVCNKQGTLAIIRQGRKPAPAYMDPFLAILPWAADHSDEVSHYGTKILLDVSALLRDHQVCTKISNH